MLIACGNDTQFARMMAVLGAPEMAKDERYTTNAARVVNRGTLIPQLCELTPKFTRTELTAKLEAVGVPAGPINSIADAFANPQVIARGMRIDRPHPDAKGGSIPGVRTPITINGYRAAADRAQPKVGEHTDEILREIGEA
jgi:crotonobetainyl-CoA:carnitine CoA-transferase CaiB-like acyl-CoA transferase